jgi:hypothetical protein
MGFNSAPSGMGNGSEKVTPPQETSKEILEGYVAIAEQSKRERENMPSLPKAEESKIRSRIEDLKMLEQDMIFKENQFRDNNPNDEHIEEHVQGAFTKTRLAYEEERSRLERQLTGSTLEA